MSFLRRGAAALTARLRARRHVREGITVGTGVRFGRDVRCTVKGTGRITIGDRVEICPGVRVLAASGAHVSILDGTFVGPQTGIAATQAITIGRESMIAESVTIRDHDHDPAWPPRSGRMLQAEVVIGDRVWIAAKASVGRGVVIGDDAVIGAHALVNRSIPGDALAVGVPARVVRSGIRHPQARVAVDDARA